MSVQRDMDAFADLFLRFIVPGATIITLLVIVYVVLAWLFTEAFAS